MKMAFEKNLIIIVFYIFINMYLLKEILLASSVYGRDAVMGNLDLRAFPTSYLPENCFSGHERTPIPIE